MPLSNLHKYFQRSENKATLYFGIYGTTKKLEVKEEGKEDEYLPGQIDIEGGNPTQLIGSAVFKEGEMISSLTGDETRIAMIRRPNSGVSSIFAAYPDPIESGYRISARIYKGQNAKFKIDLKKEMPEIYVTIPISVFVIKIPSEVDYVEDLDKQKLLEKSRDINVSRKRIPLVASEIAG